MHFNPGPPVLLNILFACYAGNQVHPVFEWTYLQSYRRRAEVVGWQEQQRLLQRKHIPLTHFDMDVHSCSALGASCSCSSVLDRDSVHAFNDTVDLFTALWGIHMVKTQPRCQNRLSLEWSCEGLRHRSGAARLCNTIPSDMWDWAWVFCVT